MKEESNIAYEVYYETFSRPTYMSINDTIQFAQLHQIAKSHKWRSWMEY